MNCVNNDITIPKSWASIVWVRDGYLVVLRNQRVRGRGHEIKISSSTLAVVKLSLTPAEGGRGRWVSQLQTSLVHSPRSTRVSSRTGRTTQRAAVLQVCLPVSAMVLVCSKMVTDGSALAPLPLDCRKMEMSHLSVFSKHGGWTEVPSAGRVRWSGFSTPLWSLASSCIPSAIRSSGVIRFSGHDRPPLLSPTWCFCSLLNAQSYWGFFSFTSSLLDLASFSGNRVITVTGFGKIQLANLTGSLEITPGLCLALSCSRQPGLSSLL